MTKMENRLFLSPAATAFADVLKIVIFTLMAQLFYYFGILTDRSIFVNEIIITAHKNKDLSARQFNCLPAGIIKQTML